jgi:hypothetical protein
MCKVYLFRGVERHLRALNNLAAAFTICSHHNVRIRDAVLRSNCDVLRLMMTDSFDQALIAGV